MSSGASMTVDAVEAGYRFDGDRDQWFARVLDVLHGDLERGLGTFGLSYRVVGGRIVLEQLTARRCPDAVLEFVRVMYANVSGDALRTICGHAGDLRAFSEFLRHVPAEQAQHYRDALGALGAKDGLLAGYPDGDGGWITFAALADAPLRTVPKQRTSWTRMCAHLATGWRLRQRLGSARDGIEAVVSRSGAILDASGAAAPRAQRERLREAAQAIGRARGSLRRRDPEAAMELWRGLVSGRWSLIDRADSDGATVLVAHKNDPASLDPRGLSPRERAIVELALTGAPSKQIAYTLGLADATVATHLRHALRKLGLPDRAALMRLGGLSGAEVAGAAIGETDVRVLVIDGAERDLAALTAAERDVANHVRVGLSNAEIARRRGTSERTVANQLARIFEKLDIGSRAQLVLHISRSLAQ